MKCKYILNMAASVFFSLLTTSCFTDFEPDIESKPVVCLNALITAGDTIEAEVTRTWRYSEGDPVVAGYDIFLQDSEVSLFVNDRFAGKMQPMVDAVPPAYWHYKERKYFKSDYVARSGDKIKICVDNKSYGQAEAETFVTDAVPLDGTDVKILKKNVITDNVAERKYECDFEILLEATFIDPADSQNFYIFDLGTKTFYISSIESSQPYSSNATIYPDYEFEPLFSEHISPLETITSDGLGYYTVFSDRQISGKKYSLKIPVKGKYFYYNPSAINEGTAELIVRLYHISRPYYNYMLSLWSSTEGIDGALGGVGLGDAVFEYSNVSSKAGIVATRASSEIRINLHHLLATGI